MCSVTAGRAGCVPRIVALNGNRQTWTFAISHNERTVMVNNNLQVDNGMSALAKVVITIASIGAINWGLIGFFNWNLVDAIFGGGAREMTSAVSRVVYAIVGLAGLMALVSLTRIRAANGARLEAAPHSR